MQRIAKLTAYGHATDVCVVLDQIGKLDFLAFPAVIPAPAYCRHARGGDSGEERTSDDRVTQCCGWIST
jgi:hypothetical protein